jgi:transposase, mutator family
MTNTGNSRNGYYEHSLHTIFGNITIKIPPDRLGQFQNKLLTPYNRNFGNLEEIIIQLYQKGITTREIADIIEKMYGCYYSPQTISNMTQVVVEEMVAFHNLPLPSQFAVVYLDATFITVKHGTAQKKALHVLIGITPSGEKHVIDYGIYPDESTFAYKELLNHVKQGGL